MIEPWLGATIKEGGDRHGTMVQGIFPAGIIHWFSSPELKAVASRTINRVERLTTHANFNVTMNIARAARPDRRGHRQREDAFLPGEQVLAGVASMT